VTVLNRVTVIRMLTVCCNDMLYDVLHNFDHDDVQALLCVSTLKGKVDPVLN
jgi:hypothetical protein